MKPIQTIPIQLISAEPYILVVREITKVEDHCAGRIGKNLRKSLPGYTMTKEVISQLLDTGQYQNTYRYYAKLAPVCDGKNL